MDVRKMRQLGQIAFGALALSLVSAPAFAQEGAGLDIIGMFETMASFMLAEHASGMLFDPPLGPAHYHRAVARNRKPYRTRDGYVAALVYNNTLTIGTLSSSSKLLEFTNGEFVSVELGL